MSRIVAGQNVLIDRLIAAMLSDGHVLLEGLPGLAKTLAVKTLAQSLDGDFARIQFTPDLLPADVVGTSIYNPAEHSVPGFCYHAKFISLSSHADLLSKIFPENFR